MCADQGTRARGRQRAARGCCVLTWRIDTATQHDALPSGQKVGAQSFHQPVGPPLSTIAI